MSSAFCLGSEPCMSWEEEEGSSGSRLCCTGLRMGPALGGGDALGPWPMCSITVCMVREESRQDFLSAALAPGLMANRAAEVCPFIVEGSCLHNSTRRSLYLALFLCLTPAAAVPRSAISAQMEVNPYAWERSGLLCPVCLRPGAAGGALSGVSFCRALLGTLVISKPGFLQAPGWRSAIRMPFPGS